MAEEEPLKRFEQAGAAFVNAAYNRLDGFFKARSEPGDDERDPAEGEPRAPRRERADQLIETIRSEIRSQLLHLGLATREELDEVRSRLDDLESRLGHDDSDPGGTSS